MSKPEIVWQKGLVTAEDLSGRRPYLLRFHSSGQIPGPVRSTCIIAQPSMHDLDAVIAGWHGQVLAPDPATIEAFCRRHHFPAAHWWRYREGRDPYQVWLYQNFP